jgi:7,8-dihydroneopterin aldolase/epimerase/oxygenase
MNYKDGVLKIIDLRIWAHHGWYAEEREIGGEYRLDIDIGLDLPKTSLQLEDTIDYQEVVDLANEVMRKEYKLIEESCRSIFDALDSLSNRTKWLSVTVEKLNIPINNLSSTSFTLTNK